MNSAMSRSTQKFSFNRNLKGLKREKYFYDALIMQVKIETLIQKKKSCGTRRHIQNGLKQSKQQRFASVDRRTASSVKAEMNPDFQIAERGW